MDHLCCDHYIECLDCAFCCIVDEFEYSLICKQHLLRIITCKVCLRVHYFHIYGDPKLRAPENSKS